MRSIVFLSAVMVGLAGISQTKLMLSIIESGKYPYDYPLSTISCGQENQKHKFVSLNTERCIPELFTTYYYPRAKMDKYGRWSFFVTEIIKNYGNSSWQLRDHKSLINLFVKDSLVINISFVAREKKKSPSEGWTSYGRNDIELEAWTPFTPNLYNLMVNSFNSPTEDEVLQIFKRRIGIRSIKYSLGSISINDNPVSKQVINIDSSSFFETDIKAIRKNHFNTIVASDLISKEALAICDSIGLMVIQNLVPENIQDTTNFLINYFDQYTHPSLIAWNVSDSPELVQILSELDPKRPVIDLGIDYQRWNELDSAERVRVMHRQQPYSFWFDRQKGIIKLLKNNDFYDLEMKIEWAVLKNGDNIETGESQLYENQEVKIESLQNLDSSLGLIISLKAAEDKLHYQQGDLISWDEFYFQENGNYVETRKRIF
ncbi:hypothetical protein [Ekhidna sp.]|uniref:hypothetical protein n=1 Tax=Ekhidna sp. TaxID=2608089 RepID=UPI003CCB8E02